MPVQSVFRESGLTARRKTGFEKCLPRGCTLPLFVVYFACGF